MEIRYIVTRYSNAIDTALPHVAGVFANKDFAEKYVIDNILSYVDVLRNVSSNAQCDTNEYIKNNNIEITDTMLKINYTRPGQPDNCVYVKYNIEAFEC